MHCEQFLLQFGQLLRVGGGEVVLFLPVLLDVIELEVIQVLTAEDLPFAVTQGDVNVGASQVVAPVQRDGPFDWLFHEDGTDVYPVYGTVVGQWNACYGQHGGENVGSYDRDPVRGACRHLTRPAYDAGDADAALVGGTLPLAKSAGGTACTPIVAISLGTVVGSEYDEGVLGFA